MDPMTMMKIASMFKGGMQSGSESKIDPKIGLTNTAGAPRQAPSNVVQSQPVLPLPVAQPIERDIEPVPTEVPTGGALPTQAPVIPVVEKQQSPEMMSLIASILGGEGSTRGDLEGQSEFYDRFRRR